MHKLRKPEYRATAKSLAEQRAEAVREMQAIVAASQTETRAITDEENQRLEELEKSVKDIDRTLEAQKRALEMLKPATDPKEPESGNPSEPPNKTEIPEADKRAFMDTVHCLVEKRAGEQNFTMGNNGAIIPQSIARRIITEVKQVCPIFAGCTRYSAKGTIKVPVYGDKTVDGTGHNITVGYQEEFTELTADAGAFNTIDLAGYLVGALTLIGKSVINNSDLPVFDFIITEMVKRIKIWIEKELLVGTNGKCTGALSTATLVKSGSASGISADTLIDLQSAVPTDYQANACWTMNPKTFATLRKLKDSSGQYLLQQSQNIVNAFPYMLLGKPVYLSDNMPQIGSGSKAILYGDYSGLYVNMREQIEMQVLLEKYATQHAVGIVSWFEIDSKIAEHEKLAVLEMAEAAS